jgi:hypothetical protein
MLGIKGYYPKIYTKPINLLKEQKPEFEELLGKTINDILIVWDQTNKEWFCDYPVIFSFDHCKLELCAHKFDEYLISYNQIRVSNDIYWQESDLLLKWEKNKLEITQSAIGQVITKIEIIYRYEAVNSDYVYLYGLGFTLNDGYIAICNGMDENAILRTRQEDSHFKHIVIASI